MNEMENTVQNLESDLFSYICLSKFRESLFKSIINSLNIPVGSNGLDAACGIGFFTKILAHYVGEGGNVTGLDISNDFINYANQHYRANNIRFKAGNITALPFDDNTFDWLFSADTVWSGPKEFGCPSAEPLPIIKQFYRVIKPGGFVCLLFWSSQKLLPGYPLLEARLNTTSTATAPFTEGMEPANHILNAKHWLAQANFKDILAKTYLSDIIAPLNENDLNALTILLQMLWGESESEMSDSDWQNFKRLCDLNSDDYILNNPFYYGFYTYTFFKGIK